MTEATTAEWVCRIPDNFVEGGEWEKFWEASVRAAGETPAGEPSLDRREQGQVDGEPLFPDDPAVAFFARGPVLAAEQIRSIRIQVEVDTNRRTIAEDAYPETLEDAAALIERLFEALD